ncbi:DUF1707 domain-containing protein [Blastococcus sp. MG754426]|uniref:DUF1707 SHOCT-like domain-containing protein n=1 Tax=unclassified Blastococcus TaxID=2619396 RepID=UPI001EF0461D|nr:MULTISPECIES: DUF1707 domain-containing protein [unclassified Blastococcus]MCF6509202.1 DUF1707 domain-containing protein [Blastococcus sp. MG754426]MCF6513770.1 DUF1707 domain-containing protein [Blastococcus sp. MG754427]MCF6736318.1 DUF1707 domain-containing protein [Blastococcus sp. KM273129]
MSSPEDLPPPPAVRVSDAEREAVVAQLQRAVGEGRIDLDEFGQRAAAAYEAVTRAELDALVADLPPDALPPVQIVGQRAAEEVTSVFGDITLAVATTPPRRVGTVFGDVRIDLRGLRTDADRVDLTVSTVFGDIDVILAEGVDGELHGRTVFGDRKLELAPVPRLAGTPLVVVHARAVFGDLRLRSLAPGESPSRWRALMDRLAQNRQPPPQPPAPGAPPPLPPPRF